MLKSLIAIVTACAFLALPELVLCDEHLVTKTATEARLAQAASQRAKDTRLLQDVFSTPQAAAAAGKLGVSIDRTRAAVPLLSDRELRDLATRAAALGANPVSGHYGDYAYHDFMMIFLLVVLVAAVIVIADRY